MNHATITRFTPQSQESRHKETADHSWAQNSLNSLFPAFFREHMFVMSGRMTNMRHVNTCSSCQAALLTSYKFCPLCGQSKESNDSVERSKFTPAPTTSRSSSKTLGYKQFKELKEEKWATYFRRDSREKKNRNATERLEDKVTVNVGFMKYDGVDMKGQRGKSLPLTITKSSDRQELMDAAFAKLKAHNTVPEMKAIGDYEILYPDATVVEKLRESDELFVLHKYKKEYGKPYNRIAFYLSLKTDLFKYKLHTLKEAMYSSASSGSDSEGTESV